MIRLIVGSLIESMYYYSSALTCDEKLNYDGPTFIYININI